MFSLNNFLATLILFDLATIFYFGLNFSLLPRFPNIECLHGQLSNLQCLNLILSLDSDHFSTTVRISSTTNSVLYLSDKSHKYSIHDTSVMTGIKTDFSKSTRAVPPPGAQGGNKIGLLLFNCHPKSIEPIVVMSSAINQTLLFSF